MVGLDAVVQYGDHHSLAPVALLPGGQHVHVAAVPGAAILPDTDTRGQVRSLQINSPQFNTAQLGPPVSTAHHREQPRIPLRTEIPKNYISL